jgi:hypothetical protein
MKLFTVYDSKAEHFANPVAAPSIASFTRDVGMTLKNPPNQPSAFHEHPHDYRLYCVGEFDEAKGILLPSDQPEYLGTAGDYLQPVASAA